MRSSYLKRANTATSSFTKKALIRDPSVPPGRPAPMHLVCVCGSRVECGEGFRDNVKHTCLACGQKYDGRGYLLDEQEAI